MLYLLLLLLLVCSQTLLNGTCIDDICRTIGQVDWAEEQASRTDEFQKELQAKTEAMGDLNSEKVRRQNIGAFGNLCLEKVRICSGVVSGGNLAPEKCAEIRETVHYCLPSYQPPYHETREKTV